MSQRCEDAHTDWSRGLVRLWLRHDTLLGALRDLLTSGVAAPVVLERLSNTPACLSEASSRTLDLSRERWEDAHTNWPRGLVRLWLRHDTLLSALRGAVQG